LTGERKKETGRGSGRNQGAKQKGSKKKSKFKEEAIEKSAKNSTRGPGEKAKAEKLIKAHWSRRGGGDSKRGWKT